MATFTPRPPKPTSGELAIAYLSRLAGWLDQLVNWLNVSPGGRPLIITCKTPVGGIAARSGTTRSSASCTLYGRGSTDAALSLGTTTVTVWNDYLDAVPANSLIKAHLEQGQYRVLTVGCTVEA